MARSNRMGDEGREWLRQNYARGTVHDTLDAFEARFGWRPTPRTVYVQASRMGLRKELRRQDPRIRADRAQVRVAWSREPTWEAWMLEHDTGGHEATIEAFEREFGIRLSRGQVNLFRASHGTQKRASHGGGRTRRPVGYERETKGGILVKVAEEAAVPMSKDNWRFKHHIAYEDAYGPIPEGHVVMAVDGDSRNCDPGNLVAVDRRAVGALNQMRGEGLTWQDRETMLACVAIASLKVGVNDAESAMGRTCAVCGRRFAEPAEKRRYGKRTQTCPECLRAGRKAGGVRRSSDGCASRECAVCGAAFAPTTRRERRCPECKAARPRIGVERHRRYYEKHGRR